MIYLDSRICRLCKWPAPGLLCASIHYHHKALDVSPLRLFCAKHWARGRAGGRTRLSITGSVTRAAGGAGQTERNVSVKLTSRVESGRRDVSTVTEDWLCLLAEMLSVNSPGGFSSINQLTAWSSQVTLVGTQLLFLSYAISRHSICWLWDCF